MTSEALATSRNRRRGWQFSLTTLLLLPVLGVVGFWLFPRILEEGDPVQPHMILMEFTEPEWSTDEKGRRQYEAEMVFASEEPFRLSLSSQEVESVMPDGGPPRAKSAVTQIGQFTPILQFVGHNYVLRLHLLVRGATVRIGSDQLGWHEKTLLDSNGETSWQLTETASLHFSRERTIRNSVGTGLGEWAFTQGERAGDSTTQVKRFQITLNFSADP